MARVPFVTDETAGPRAKTMFDANVEGFGRVANYVRLMAHAPHILMWDTPLTLAVKSSGTGKLDKDLKNAIILRVSALNECAYCVHHNLQYGRGVGAAPERMQALLTDGWSERTDLFAERDIVALRWAELVARNEARRDRDVFPLLEQHFDAAEIVEITYVAAHRTMRNLVQEALWNDIEDDSTPEHRHMPGGFLQHYATEVLPTLIEMEGSG